MQSMPPWDEVNTFWFGDRSGRWFSKEPAFDALVKARFGKLVERALAGKLDEAWTRDPKGALALVIVLDQMPRNMFRGTPKAFAGDARALNIAKAMDTDGFTIKERVFAYLPFEHSEDPADQKTSTGLFRALSAKHPANDLARSAAEYAKKHAYVIRRFGRFPHRNEVLGRTSTNEESRFLLNSPSYSF